MPPLPTCHARLAAGAQARPAAPRLVVRCSSKGFGGEGGGKAKQSQKVSKRGKVASRPDPAQQLKQLQQEQAAYEAQLREVQAAAPTAQQPPPQQQAQQAAAAVAPPTVGGAEYETTPQVVTDRMLRRILAFAGLPVVAGLGLFPFFYFLKVTKGVDLPTWAVYIASTLTFGGGLFGISYGILSASWDPRREGSLLGTTEFKANLPVLMERFKRQ